MTRVRNAPAPCACGAALDYRNKSGMCQACYPRATNAAKRVKIGPEFATVAPGKTNEELIAYFGVSAPTISRYRSRYGIPAPRQSTGHRGDAPPADFADLAPTMTMQGLCEHYGCSEWMITQWLRACEVQTRGRIYNRTASYKRVLPMIADRAGRSFNPRLHAHHDDTLAGRAADHLRRFGPVIRCNSGGRYDPKGDHYLRGSTVLSRAETVERAIAKGFDPEAWRRVA